MFWGCYNDVSRMIPGCFKGISKLVFYGCFKEMLRNFFFQACFNELSGRVKRISSVFQESFMGVSRMF